MINKAGTESIMVMAGNYHEKWWGIEKETTWMSGLVIYLNVIAAL